MGAIRSLLTIHPFKAIYSLLALCLETARLPLWLLLYILPAGRPHAKWTYRQALRTRLLKAFLYHSSMVEVRTPLSLVPGAEKDRWIVMSPAPGECYQGPLEDREITPERIGGTWYPGPYPSSASGATQKSLDNDDDYIVLHFHGGAYVLGDGRTQDAGFLASTLLKHAHASRVFAPQYRLSSNPGGRFPAALQDAVTSYWYLVRTLRIPTHKIVVSGDSAGGNLALALLRYLTEYGGDLDLLAPSAALLWSPWVNVAASQDPRSTETNPNYPTDYLAGRFGAWGVRCFLGDSSAPHVRRVDPSDPYVSPLGYPFKTPTPLWVQTGGAEVLCQDNKGLVEELRAAGNDVELWVEDKAVHDIALVGHLVGFEKEAGQCAKRAGEWVRANRRVE